MRYLLVTLCCVALLALPAYAQVNVTLGWDPSITPSPPENPINYRIYKCTDVGLTSCVMFEAGTGLTYGPLALQHASTQWFYATAWNYDLESETGGEVKQFNVQESDKSNILRVKAFAPPGNPKNSRIQVTQISQSKSGTMLLAEIR